MNLPQILKFPTNWMVVTGSKLKHLAMSLGLTAIYFVCLCSSLSPILTNPSNSLIMGPLALVHPAPMTTTPRTWRIPVQRSNLLPQSLLGIGSIPSPNPDPGPVPNHLFLMFRRNLKENTESHLMKLLLLQTFLRRPKKLKRCLQLHFQSHELLVFLPLIQTQHMLPNTSHTLIL